MRIDTVTNDNIVYHVNGINYNQNSPLTSSVKKQGARSSIFAGNLASSEDKTGNKKLLAGRQALRTLINQYTIDIKTDTQVSDLKDNRRKLLDDAKLTTDQIKELDKSNAELRNSSGIKSDSTEQKNLELLEKSIYHPDKMTAEEQNQLKNIGPLTDYQKAALKNDAMKNILQDKVNQTGTDVMNIDRTITGIALERLKTHPMIDAQKEAAKILEAATKDVVSTLLNDGKENIDKKVEEENKAVEKKQEEQEQKPTTDNNTKPAEQTNPVDQSTLSDSKQINQLQLADQLKLLAKKQNLKGDDVKGIVVDQAL